MAPENVQVVHLKLQMQPDIDFFKKLLKDNQAQETNKNLRIYPSLQEEFINFSMNHQISYIKTRRQPPALTAKYKKICVDCVKKKVTWTKEKWETVIFQMKKSLICMSLMEGKQNSAWYINVLEKILPIYESSRH